MEPGSSSNQSPDRTWPMLCHISALAGFLIPFANIGGPFLVWQLKKEELGVLEHGRQSLNFQILISLTMIALMIMTSMGAFVLGMLPSGGFRNFFLGSWGSRSPWAYFAVAAYSAVFAIMNGIKANNGESTRYPLTHEFIKSNP